MTQNLVKVAEHSFCSGELLLMQFTACTRIAKKKNMLLNQQSLYLLIAFFCLLPAIFGDEKIKAFREKGK